MDAFQNHVYITKSYAQGHTLLNFSRVEVRELGDESIKLMFWIDVLFPYVLKTRSFLVGLKKAAKF